VPAAGLLAGGNADAWREITRQGLLLPVLLGVAGIGCVMLAAPVLMLAVAGLGRGR